MILSVCHIACSGSGAESSAYFADLEVSIRSEKLLTNLIDQDPFGLFPTLRWESANRRGSPSRSEGLGSSLDMGRLIQNP